MKCCKQCEQFTKVAGQSCVILYHCVSFRNVQYFNSILWLNCHRYILIKNKHKYISLKFYIALLLFN